MNEDQGKEREETRMQRRGREFPIIIKGEISLLCYLLLTPPLISFHFHSIKLSEDPDTGGVSSDILSDIKVARARE